MPVINRETDYAIRALAHLAREGDTVSVSDLAASEAVPADFLRKIMQKLLRARVVKSSQGSFGGYRLRKAPEDMTLLDVLEAVQGPLCMNACFADPNVCKTVKVCALRKRLMSMQKEINEWFRGINLADLAQSVPQKQGVHV